MTTILTRTPKAPLNIRRMSFGERLRVKQQRNAVRSSFLGAKCNCSLVASGKNRKSLKPSA